MDSPDQVLTCGGIRVFQDPDGYELVEQSFDNGSTVLMHKAQWNALDRAFAVVHKSREQAAG